ncbi:MAG: 30S ribosomal protein S3 [Candidatus Neomarinimicrobiota bacterium]|nr:30S ribosomal protein S3 [Candidatus Neomarinimicrobiota bacterium]MCD6099380.1 30S ribosomal protein S3 [Candidatus Neomarinimicrobiota bacterium]RKY48015.1 MAG: 30S ribosomal protein S3 [Candidatus Neomarinimicrobiota bacterium]RKY48680.1 MAG: 30S ribosomal protein S3 [Candidatus Neomarinimicrobiota bacterium]RKY54558.1 MAG: 30S ribosomal protein S3 [Candidatus Neomarinimicrobiota bacterium]
MGQKTHPIGFRLGFNKTWSSIWFDERNFKDRLLQDYYLRKYINNRLPNAGISRIEIKRTPKLITVIVHTSRPGMVIGQKGKEVDLLKAELKKITGTEVYVNVSEVKRPELDAVLVAKNIANQIARKVSYKKVVKKAIQSAMRMGAQGIRIQVSGRLGGAEMSRKETYREGRVPLHTLRADIDYAVETSHTTYGCIGVKVWICRGEKTKVEGE